MNDLTGRPRVLWVTPEAAPYASTGGLAEVAGAMPRRLHAAGFDVALLMPCYTDRCSSGEAPEIIEVRPLEVEIGGHVFQTEVIHAIGHGSLPLRMLRYDEFFSRPGIYAAAGHDYPDNHLRFALLCKAACEIIKSEGYEIAHLHDWPAALTAVLLATHYRDDPALANVRILQSIHNLAHPGNFQAHTLDQLGLARELGLWNLMGHQDEVSWLKGGLLLADGLHTVSPTYAQEILEPECGCQMEGLLRLRRERLFGVLNGIDYEEWNPMESRDLLAPFSADDLAGKAKGKEFVLDTFGMKPSRGTPLIAFVGRMAPQKGLDLLLDIAPALIAKGAQLLIVGSGREDLEVRCRELARSFPGQVGVHIGFERSLAHQVISGADMVVMPSLFEPCGLTQLQAMRYGTIPVVHAVGGLVDTVCNTTATTLSSGRATGFVFRKLSSRALLLGLNRALKAYHDRRLWQRLMRNAMKQDFSWVGAVPGYEDMYRRVLEGEPWRAGFELPMPGRVTPPEPAPFIDWGPDLPDRYHEDTIALMVQSPTQLYVYWELQPGRARSGSLDLVVDREGESWVEARGQAEVGEAWIEVLAARDYRVRLIDGTGQVLLLSNPVRTPRDTPSTDQETRWLAAEERRRRHVEVARRRARKLGEPVPTWGYEEVEHPQPIEGSSELRMRSKRSGA